MMADGLKSSELFRIGAGLDQGRVDVATFSIFLFFWWQILYDVCLISGTRL
jgi:hypothetical protein